MAVYDSSSGLLGHALHSQVAMHARFGGVVPELASRDHVRKLLPLLRELDFRADTIDGVAYTAGPGLIGSLLVGASIGRALAWAWNVAAVGVHHMEGHLLAPMLEEESPEFPFVALLVSGGHTQLVRVGGVGDYSLLGESLDDAAGEAFDKTAKLLGLGYPGGPALARLAEQGDPDKFRFPRPMTNRPGLDFSFSGLKTFALNTLQRHRDEPGIHADIARAFQDAVIDTLIIKSRRALRQTGLRHLVVAGGVSANSVLRDRLKVVVDEVDGQVWYPRPAFCTDNGAMIAYAGCQRLLAGERQPLAIGVRARWPLAGLTIRR